MPKFSKDFQILMHIDEGDHVYSIFKKMDITYNYLHKTIKLWEKRGFLKTKKHGRIKLVELTKKGEELRDLLCKAKVMFK